MGGCVDVGVSSFLIIRKSLTMTRYNSRDLLLPPPHKPSLIHMISPGQYRFECFFYFRVSAGVFVYQHLPQKNNIQNIATGTKDPRPECFFPITAELSITRMPLYSTASLWCCQPQPLFQQASLDCAQLGWPKSGEPGRK